MEREKIIAVRDELRKKLEEKNSKAKVGKIVYYKDFEVVKGDESHSAFSEQDIFVVTRKIEQDGLKLEYYEIYDENCSLIANTDGMGEITYSDEYIKKLGPAYSYMGLKDRKMYLNREDEFIVNDKPTKDLTPEEKQESKEKQNEYEKRKLDNVEPAIVEDDLGIDRKSITYCQEIKDERFFDLVPESKEFSRTGMLVLVKGEFMIVGMKDGKFQPYTSIEPSKPTLKTSKDLDRDGSNIKDEGISGVLRFKQNREYDFAANIEADGRVEFQMLRRNLETNEIISSDLQTSTQFRASSDVEELMSKAKNEEVVEAMEKLNEQDGEGTIEDIKKEVEDEKEEEKEEEEEEEQKVPWEREER